MSPLINEQFLLKKRENNQGDNHEKERIDEGKGKRIQECLRQRPLYS